MPQFNRRARNPFYKLICTCADWSPSVALGISLTSLFVDNLQLGRGKTAQCGGIGELKINLNSIIVYLLHTFKAIGDRYRIWRFHCSLNRVDDIVSPQRITIMKFDIFTQIESDFGTILRNFPLLRKPWNQGGIGIMVFENQRIESLIESRLYITRLRRIQRCNICYFTTTIESFLRCWMILAMNQNTLPGQLPTLTPSSAKALCVNDCSFSSPPSKIFLRGGPFRFGF